MSELPTVTQLVPGEDQNQTGTTGHTSSSPCFSHASPFPGGLAHPARPTQPSG